MEPPQSNNNLTPKEQISTVKQRYWSLKFAITNLILVFLAAIAAYLEYVAYPALMTQVNNFSGGSGPFGFGETIRSLKLSFLTYQYNVTRCYPAPCTSLAGLPSFDFFQMFILAIVIINIVHFYNVTRK